MADLITIEDALIKPSVKTNKPVPEKDIIVDVIKESVKKRLEKIRENLTETKVFESTISDFEGELESPKFSVPSDNESYKYFVHTQRWIGHVEEIKHDGFIAKLTDLSDNTTYEMGEFDFDEVSPEDMPLLTVGATFYWSLGRANENGQIEKKALMRFQRVRPWTEKDYDRIVDRAEDKFKKLKWN